MRIALDATFLGTGRGGDETFLLGLLEGLTRCRAPEDVFPLLVRDGVAVPGVVAGDPGFPVVRLRGRPGPVHFGVTLPTALRRLPELDLALSVTHAPVRGRVPTVLVLGDLSFVHRGQDYPWPVRLRLRGLVPSHVRQAAAVLVPSEYTRRDVLRTYGADPARVHVVPNRVPAARPPDPVEADREAAALAVAGVRPPYLLYVGNLHPRKNVPGLIRAFRAARRTVPALRDHRLVVAGSPWFGSTAEREAAAGDPSVLFLGRVSDTARSLLYAGAEALGYLSYFEGFGLPPLEAMAHGVPVLTTTVTSLPEVCGEAALLVDPTDPAAVSAGVGRILTDEPLRTRLRGAGRVRAAGYDVDRVGQAAMTAFRAATGCREVPVLPATRTEAP